MIRGVDDFSNATLLLVGHGSTQNAESCAPVYQRAKAIRERNLFAEVRECFWKQEPHIAPTLATITTPGIFVVPLFISEGYFTQQIIPRELGLREEGKDHFEPVQSRGRQTIHYTGPVGTHSSVTAVLLARARDVVARHPFPRAPQSRDIALFIVGHGTGNNKNSRKAVEDQVDRIRQLNFYAEVHAVFMEESPKVTDCYSMTSRSNLVVVPCFISDGLHAREDIPVMLGETPLKVRERLERKQFTWNNPTEKQGKRVWYTRSIGTEPLLADVILERVSEAAKRS